MNKERELLRRVLEEWDEDEDGSLTRALVADIRTYLSTPSDDAEYLRGWNAAIDAAVKECQVMIKRPQRKYGTGEIKGSFEMRRRGQECEIAIKALRKEA
jgi:hypothetical protein